MLDLFFWESFFFFFKWQGYDKWLHVKQFAAYNIALTQWTMKASLHSKNLLKEMLF